MTELLLIIDMAVATLVALVAIISVFDLNWKDRADVAVTAALVVLVLWSPARLLWIEFGQLVVLP